MAMSSEERERRRKEIIAAATEVFLEKGFAGASLREIAERARASKETLYAWFGNKSQLIATLIQEGMKEIGARVTAEVMRGTPESVLYTIAVEVLRMINFSPLMRLFSAAGAEARNSPELRRVIVESALNHSGTAALLEHWRAQGLVRFDVSGEQIASIFVAMVQAEYPAKLSLGVIDRLSDKEIEVHARLVTDMFMKAVAP